MSRTFRSLTSIIAGLGVIGLLLALRIPAGAEIILSTKTPKQGQTIEIKFVPDQAGQGETNEAKDFCFNGQTFKLFDSSNKDSESIKGSTSSRACESAVKEGHDHGLLEGLLAIPADLKPGSYTLTVSGQPCQLTIQDGKFPVQRLNLPKSKDNFIMSPGEKEAVEAAKSVVSYERLWQGAFIKPCKARQSAGFGMKRVVNGHLLKDYFHSGVDFAAPAGKPVYAAQAGKVVLAHTGFKLHGNVIAIDHGQGVISFYLHLKKINVKEGQTVEANEQIGQVGQTGRANGPHLHFSIYVNQTASNPTQWFAYAF